MGAAFYVEFEDPTWRHVQAKGLRGRLAALPTYVSRQPDGAFWLRGTEAGRPDADWDYDVRVFPEHQPRILLEISDHPPSIEADLTDFLSWLRGRTAIRVVDEDGQDSGW